LANRPALEEALEVALAEGSGAPGDRVAVLMIDLDGFKQINDSLGHDRGDQVLQEVARRLHANVFEYDTAARLGGDEFAVVLRRLRAADDIAVVANRLRDALVRPIRIDDVFRFVGASIGASAYPGHGVTSTELLRNADAAMYQAKRGREGVRVYQSGTEDGAASLGLAAALLTAIERDEIGLVFQPEYSLATGAVTGVEALARWQPDGSAAVPPTEFVVLAEETGLIRGLTMLTLRKALDEAVGWRRNGHDLPVSVNLSGGVLGDVTLPNEVQRLLDERELPASALVLEITETAVIHDRQVAIEVLRRLREAGVAIELDDFGSGHASFSALRDLPLDGVKIDRQLVADQAGGDAKLLAATVELAHHLGLYVVAEGIEDEDTLVAVRRAGCDSAQGYHLARPMASVALDEVLGRAARPASL
jgi:diguanylate cyclase (GGDEF)-like protein